MRLKNKFQITPHLSRGGLKRISDLAFLSTAFMLGSFFFTMDANAVVPSYYGLAEGDLISATGSDDPDIYIVNEHGYKRLFLNPTIFNFYGHLKWENVRSVSSITRDAFVTSGLFRNCEANDPKVYGVEITGEDVGTFHWVNVTAEQALSEDPDFFRRVFCINNAEFSWYPKGSVYTAINQIPVYSRTPSPPSSFEWQFLLEEKQLILSPAYADPSVILMPDGQYLMYVNTMGGLSGVSGAGTFAMSSNDGVSWTRQTDIIFSGVATGRAFKEPNGIRFYYPKPERAASYAGENPPKDIASSFSSDGISAWRDEGVLVQPRQGFTVTGPGIVRLEDGTYRMFFDEFEPQPLQPGGGFTAEGEIWGASSSDGLSWTRDSNSTIVYENQVEGVVFQGSQPPQVLHPAMIAWPEQSGYLMLYNAHSEIFAAFSQDGYAWQKRGHTGIHGADADIVRLPDARFRIYWGGGCTSTAESGCADPQTGQILASTVHSGILKINTDSQTPTQSPSQPSGSLTKKYLLAFHACDTATTQCSDPRNHKTYIAQSDDGTNWSLIPDYTPYSGSVPDLIRRGNTLYVYNPGQVRRYHLDTDTWENPTTVTITQSTGVQELFVDPSPILDENGKIVLLYLVGQIGGDPAGCPTGQATCTKYFHSATEVSGSDGTGFIVDSGDRITVYLDGSTIRSASDPDIFRDASQYVLYISIGPSVQVYTSASLRGNYTKLSVLPNGMLSSNLGGIPAGHYDSATEQYWTYVHTQENGKSVIRRAAHSTLTNALSASQLSTIVSGAQFPELGRSYNVESPGFAINAP